VVAKVARVIALIISLKRPRSSRLPLNVPRGVFFSKPRGRVS